MALLHVAMIKRKMLVKGAIHTLVENANNTAFIFLVNKDEDKGGTLTRRQP